MFVFTLKSMHYLKKKIKHLKWYFKHAFLHTYYIIFFVKHVPRGSLCTISMISACMWVTITKSLSNSGKQKRTATMCMCQDEDMKLNYCAFDLCGCICWSLEEHVWWRLQIHKDRNVALMFFWIFPFSEQPPGLRSLQSGNGTSTCLWLINEM